MTARRLAQEIRDSGGKAVFVQADVSREVAPVALVIEVVKAYGRLDCAFNNAGIEGVPGVREYLNNLRIEPTGEVQ
jgi:NAD(P)-dependent dehydrogenase (short-subunit alcohol dehydrogenase family)